jgi:hypothetical protein
MIVFYCAFFLVKKASKENLALTRIFLLIGYVFRDPRISSYPAGRGSKNSKHISINNEKSANAPKFVSG